MGPYWLWMELQPLYMAENKLGKWGHFTPTSGVITTLLIAVFWAHLVDMFIQPRVRTLGCGSFGRVRFAKYKPDRGGVDAPGRLWKVGFLVPLG